MENVSLTKNNGLAWLVIDRESKMNALNAGVLNDLETAFKQLENDPEVLVIAIRGAGEKAFVAGADISQFPSLTPEEAHAFALRGQSVFSRIESSRKPVIAAINGFALGGGCELALSCHLRIAAETARFGQPEVKLGVIAGYGGTQRLPRLIGTGRALDLLLTGKMISAQEALTMGLVNAVHPADALIASVEEYAASLMKQGPQAQAFTLKAVYGGAGQALSKGLEIEAESFKEAFQTEDRIEGSLAFLEKRPAVFKNK